MDDILYVIFLVLWLVFSIYKKKAKTKQAAQGAKPQGHESSTPPPPGSELESMFEEFFGEKLNKKEVHEHPVAQQMTEEPKPIREDFSEVQSPYNSIYESYSGLDIVGDDYSFEHQGLTDVSNYQMSQVDKEENRKVFFEDEKKEETKEHGILTEFDPIKAVIYSEILKRPVF